LDGREFIDALAKPCRLDDLANRLHMIDADRFLIERCIETAP
jgi:hypothetical protein